MYLKALKLHGFKSFADPTTLRFEPGVTAIVGPNGCGKSNIADAIRWVLGEQSAKALRGGKMQDVIFEGTDGRKPHHMCEVSLLLSECEEQLGSEFHEVEILRRVSRDGQGEYHLNGQACRLKDIQHLFMDTGVGRSSYSIMAQGQIDLILSSKPEERRSVFEEAAGITKYKAQRREAMAKLAQVEINLSRVADVIGEISRQIGSLRRQASKALRYKRLSLRLRRLNLALNGSEFQRLGGLIASLETHLASLQQQAAGKRGALDARLAELDALKAGRSALNQEVQQAQQSVFDLGSAREQAVNQARIAETRRLSLIERIEAGRSAVSEVEMQLRELADQADSGVQDRQMYLQLLGTSDAEYQNRNRELAVVEGSLSRLEGQLQDARFRLLELESTVARLRTEVSGLDVDQKTNLARRDAIGRDLAEASAQLEAASAKAAETGKHATAAAGRHTAVKQAVEQATQDLKARTGDYREGQRKLQEIDRSVAQRGARIKLLQQLQEKLEGFSEGAKALLQGKLPGAGRGPFTPLMKDLDVKPADARAVEALLGSAIEAVSVADIAVVEKILASLEEQKAGPVCLQIRDGGAQGTSNLKSQIPDQKGRDQKPPALPSCLRPATTALEESDKPHPAAAILRGCYIADDFPAFLAHWRRKPDFPFLLVAGPGGELADHRGIVSGGPRKKAGQSLLQRELDMREMQRELRKEQKAHDAQLAAIEALNQALIGAEQALDQRRKDVLDATQQLSALQTEDRNARAAVEAAAARAQRLERELASLDEAAKAAVLKHEKSLAGLRHAEEKGQAQKQTIASLEQQIAALRTDRDTRRESLSQSRFELAERRQKVEVIDRGLTEMERRRKQMEALLAQRLAENESWAAQVASLAEEAAAQNARAAELATTLSVARETVENLRLRLVQIEKDINATEEALSSRRTEVEQLTASCSRDEVTLAEHRAQSRFAAEEALREYQVDIAAVSWREELWRADEEPQDVAPLDLDEDEADEKPAAPGPGFGDTAPAEAAPQPEEPAEPAKAKPRARKAAVRKGPKPDATPGDLAAFDTWDWDAVRAEVAALRSRIQGMGAVNLVAIEEYASLKQRHDFLKTQSEDLASAKDQLVKAIDEINATSQRQFEIAFEQIRRNFVHTFNMLFGGGQADLQLVQTEDILECGIEIIAQPPGTRMKTITLLSGGQKTLTAVALLFALYLVKPSPFCLLDELDAPLDESNVGRFTDLLKQFTASSQFIIITHNKRTVAAANAIYGVTMEERGVSKTVSMRFNQVKGEAEAHPQTLADSVRSAKAPDAPPPVTLAPAPA